VVQMKGGRAGVRHDDRASAVGRAGSPIPS
jgi:hypothetical protein